VPPVAPCCCMGTALVPLLWPPAHAALACTAPRQLQAHHT
jgi:hypothetical protein